jgi:hypothetical protein
MDLDALGTVLESAKDFHNSSAGLNVEIILASFLIYHRVSKKFGASFQKLIGSLEIHSSTLSEHGKRLDDHDKRLGNLEKR